MDKTSEQLVRRVARIWRRAMEAPTFDQLGPTRKKAPSQEIHNEALGAFFVKKITESTTSEQLDLFEEKLAEILLMEYPYEKTGNAGRWKEDRGPIYELELSCDYDPCPCLRWACDQANLPHAQVPIKSRMSFYDWFISVSFGYGAGYEYHYPMGDGRWLVTPLTGSPAGIEGLLNYVSGKIVAAVDGPPWKIEGR